MQATILRDLYLLRRPMLVIILFCTLAKLSPREMPSSSLPENNFRKHCQHFAEFYLMSGDSWFLA